MAGKQYFFAFFAGIRYFNVLNCPLCGEVEDKMKLPEKIKALRKKNNISQQELADRADINISYLSRLENGHSEPSVEILKKLMEVLNVSADYLINDEEDNFEVKIKDRNLAERVKLIDSLDDDTREALIVIIDGLLTNQKMKEIINSKKDARMAV